MAADDWNEFHPSRFIGSVRAAAEMEALASRRFNVALGIPVLKQLLPSRLGEIVNRL